MDSRSDSHCGIVLVIEGEFWAARSGLLMVTVVNINYERADILATRPGPYGNPWSHLVYGTAGFHVKDRDEAILRFAVWFYSEKGRYLREKALAEIPDNCRLGCVCVPKSCHASIIAGYINWKRSQQ